MEIIEGVKFLSIFIKLKQIFVRQPIKIPSGHKKCGDCDGTGDYDEWIDCLECNGYGYIPIYPELSNREYLKIYDVEKNESLSIRNNE